MARLAEHKSALFTQRYANYLELGVEEWRVSFAAQEKMARLHQWYADATQASLENDGPAYRFIYVDQAGFERNPPKHMLGLTSAFKDF